MEKERKNIGNVPNLRFPEFTDQWEERKLGEVAKFSKGKGISKSDIAENGANECIRYGELYTYYGEVISDIKSRTNIDLINLVLSEENDVIIPSSGETQIDIATASCVSKSGIALGGDLNIIKTPNNGVFLSYYLNSKKKLDIANLAQGISVVHLYAGQLASLGLNLPQLSEQSKIVFFLTLIDERITTQSKIIEGLKELKASLSKQIFSRKLRFKDENGCDFTEWEEKKFGDCLNYKQPTQYIVEDTAYDDKYKTPVLTAGKTFILGYTSEKDNIYKDNLPVIIFDDFTTATQFVNFPFKVKSSAMKILVANDTTDIKFMYEYLNNMKYELGGHERHWISKFYPMTVMIPFLQEQQKTADFLSTIDNKIEVETTTHELLTKQKQYLLQQMFI